MSQHSSPQIVMLPAPRRLVAGVAVHLAEAVLIPLGLFYGVVVLVSLPAALISALAWVALAITVRLARGTKPSALLLATASLAVVQVGVTAVTSSAMVYFLQPTLATFVFAGALLASVWWQRPLIQRMAHDFVPMPDEVVGSISLRRFFRRLSFLWATVLVMNASLTLGLLLTVPTTLSMPVATAGSVPIFLLGLVASYRWFRRSISDGGYVLAWGPGPAH